VFPAEKNSGLFRVFAPAASSMTCCRLIVHSLLGVLVTAAAVAGDAPPAGTQAGGGASPGGIAGAEAVAPLLTRYCLDCHSGDAAEGEVDLALFTAAAVAGRHAGLVQRVAEMVSSGQMPPPESNQPTDAERRGLTDWLKAWLAEEARTRAGDPGRVVLRRLNNAEYTHTIRDLTGVASLDPAREFPSDGGAGEGFTNTGQSLVMSPGLVEKFLDAAKGIAAHAVFLPDSIAFSTGDSRRDFVDERLARLRAFYARFTRPLDDAARAAQTTVKQGITLDMGADGFLPVEPYVRATLEGRDGSFADAAGIEAVARERGLSPKYLSTVWRELSAADGDSPIVDRIRGLWRSAQPAESARVTAAIAGWQDAVWKFNAVGQISRHLGRNTGPASWQEPASPLGREREFRVKVPPALAGEASAPVMLHLAAGDAGDGTGDDVVLFKSPRLVAAGRSDIPLRHVRSCATALEGIRPRLAATVRSSLEAVSEALASGTVGRLDEAVGEQAMRHGLEPQILRGWFAVVGLVDGSPAFDLLQEKVTSAGGWDFVNGWKGPQGLSVLANASDSEVQVPGTLRPHGIIVHPSPERRVVAAWRSPFSGRIRVAGAVERAHAVCGNGVSWSLQIRRGPARQGLAQGVAGDRARQPLGPLEAIAVRTGDFVCLAVGSRDGNHSCDATAIDLVITPLEPDLGGPWDLAADCSGDLLAANPHADARGGDDIWHFGGEPDPRGGESVIPAGSLLARWLSPGTGDDRAVLAGSLAELIADSPPDPADVSADAVLVRMLTATNGPLLRPLLDDVLRQGQPGAGPAGGVAAPPADRPADSADGQQGIDPEWFGRVPDGIESGSVGPDDLCLRPPFALAFQIPRAIADGCELVTTATVPAGAGPQASVQPWVGVGAAPSTECSPAAVILAAESSPAWERFRLGLQAFRSLFPKALSYSRIVPVDEVVTLNLLYREDDQLVRLLLDETESAELDRLWNELLFVAQEPLELEDAFEQLRGYASQDRQDLVTDFAPMIPVIAARAEDFRRRLVEAEPRQVASVVDFARRAFRRPIHPAEAARLRGLYDRLRAKDLPHEEALRTLIAHVLVAPEFLYRFESPGSGRHPQPVDGYELATRLSYFLWSSAPDEDLLAAAAGGRLHDHDALRSQVRRMLASPAARRLAEEFGMQWLHVYGFASLDEKNAELFPTFAGLRSAMQEETILFLDDCFRRDRPILSLIDADHTFLNEALARHYGIAGVTGDEWRRVEGVRQHGRGGILGLATTLSTQAGASRTSPILRGNWLYETILGERLPRPPKDVPQLAEAVPEGLNERQMIAMHSENAACAKCHRRIDPFGFALEAFDAVGRLRTTDAAGRPIDVRATLPDGTVIDGQQGLRDYLLGPRREQFVRVFCRRLLGYALGRGVQLSDEPLLDDMVARLAAHDYRASVAIEAIVTSRQFTMIRGRDVADDSE
jgi:hypothetical protein